MPVSIGPRRRRRRNRCGTGWETRGHATHNLRTAGGLPCVGSSNITTARRELWVGYYKKASGKPSMTWPESVDEALCFGWIDGVRKSIDDERYMIRFTPRRARKHLERGEHRACRCRSRESVACAPPDGARSKHVARIDPASTPTSSATKAVLDPAFEKRFRAKKKAWAFFEAQAEVVPAGHDPLGHDGQAGGDPRTSSRDADRGLRRRSEDRAAHAMTHDSRSPIAPSETDRHVRRRGGSSPARRRTGFRRGALDHGSAETDLVGR